jgi:hypothetical protein
MKTSATDLSTNLYTWLDKVLMTGESLEIDRKGVKLVISRADRGTRLSRLPKRDTIIGSPDGIVSIDWSTEWKGTL